MSSPRRKKVSQRETAYYLPTIEARSLACDAHTSQLRQWYEIKRIAREARSAVTIFGAPRQLSAYRKRACLARIIERRSFSDFKRKNYTLLSRRCFAGWVNYLSRVRIGTSDTLTFRLPSRSREQVSLTRLSHLINDHHLHHRVERAENH
jgi:hypothetical protein